VREKSDERILGSGEFVEQLIQQSDQARKKQFSDHERQSGQEKNTSLIMQNNIFRLALTEQLRSSKRLYGAIM